MVFPSIVFLFGEFQFLLVQHLEDVFLFLPDVWRFKPLHDYGVASANAGDFVLEFIRIFS